MILVCINTHCGNSKDVPDDMTIRMPGGGELSVADWWEKVAHRRCWQCRAAGLAVTVVRPTIAGARSSDPTTSHQAAEATPWTRWKRGNQRHLLLREYGLVYGLVVNRHHSTRDGLTAEEASLLCGHPKAWRRVSELLKTDPPLIEWTGTTRVGSAGSAQMVCRITAAGLAALSVLGDP